MKPTSIFYPLIIYFLSSFSNFIALIHLFPLETSNFSLSFIEFSHYIFSILFLFPYPTTFTLLSFDALKWLYLFRLIFIHKFLVYLPTFCGFIFIFLSFRRCIWSIIICIWKVLIKVKKVWFSRWRFFVNFSDLFRWFFVLVNWFCHLFTLFSPYMKIFCLKYLNQSL